VVPAPVEDRADYSVNNAEHMLMVRAVSWVRAAYGITPWQWQPRHDKAALKALEALKRGERLPEINRGGAVPYQPDTQLPFTCFPPGFS